MTSRITAGSGSFAGSPPTVSETAPLEHHGVQHVASQIHRDPGRRCHWTDDRCLLRPGSRLVLGGFDLSEHPNHPLPHRLDDLAAAAVGPGLFEDAQPEDDQGPEQEHERGERMRGGAVAEAGEKEADEAAQESAPRKHIPSTVARHRCHFTRRTRSKTACQLNPSLVCPISRTTAASRLLEKDRAPFGGESG